MSDTVRMQPGDVYCPFCLSEALDMEIRDGGVHWNCNESPGCGRQGFQHPFDTDADGRFTWVWTTSHPKPNPGCPWCGSCNLRTTYVEHRHDWEFLCKRDSCGKLWRGTWTRYNDDWTRDRWMIHVPVGSVPWASGTTADLECYRRVPGGLLIKHSDAFPACCRWPKSCSAFDPGFTVGKGPTTLPVVWFDGFGWRSGPPDAKTIPRHLFDGIWLRWQDANPNKDLRDYWNYGPGSLPMTSPEEANDDEHDGEDTGCGHTGCPCYDGT